jgi:hypothetical protein
MSMYYFLFVGMASIMKNYMKYEGHVVCFSLHIANLIKLKSMGKYQCPEVCIMGRLLNYLHGKV